MTKNHKIITISVLLVIFIATITAKVLISKDLSEKMTTSQSLVNEERQKQSLMIENAIKSLCLIID